MYFRGRLSLSFSAASFAVFIRKSLIKNTKTGAAYYSFRLVESVRLNNKVKQKTLLNLGSHFDIDPTHWSLLAQRIEQIVQGVSAEQHEMFDLKLTLDLQMESTAQRYAALLLQKFSTPLLSGQASLTEVDTDYHFVDVNHMAILRPRSIGTESLAVHAFKQLGLERKLTEQGFNEKELAAAMGNIIARMVHPGSERETHRWLQQNSALGELLGFDYGQLSLDRLYKVTDKLLSHKKAIEAHLGEQEETLFNLSRTIILYDLTNTYFEGQALKNKKASHGRSKEKRSDCPLVTMGLVIDGDGFPLGSEIFEGNASEPKTLKTMLDALTLTTEPKSSIVVLDAGIATQENLDWLKENAYHYIVVSRERYKERPELSQGAVIVNDRVIAKRVEDVDSGEIRLYCHSQKREKKDSGIRDRFCLRYETALNKLHEGLSKKGTVKKYEKILERLGRLKEKNSRVAQEYSVNVKTDETKSIATAITWKREKSSKLKDKNAGVYCLRTDVKELTEKELWKTYVMLTEIEASFRSMKSELGLRPVYHQKEKRVTAHLFITLLAYHLVHTLRRQFKARGINWSWESIREIMASQQRVTVSMPTEDKQHIHVRLTSKAEPVHLTLYEAIGLGPDLIGPRKTIL